MNVLRSLVAVGLTLLLVGCQAANDQRTASPPASSASPSVPSDDACGGDATIPGEGLLTWLRAACGVEAADGRVTAWDSLAGGVDATPARAGLEPLLVEGAIGGRPAIRFDGVDDMLALDLDIHRSALPEVTVITVWLSETELPSTIRHPYGSDDGAFDRAVGLDWRALAFNYGVFGGESTGVIPYASIEAEMPYLTVDNFRPSRFSGWINGSKRLERAGVTNGAGPSKLFVGGSGFSYREHWLGDIAEVLVYGRTLEEGERVAIEDALAARYGIALSRAAAPAPAEPAFLAAAQSLDFAGDLYDVPNPLPPGEPGALIRLQPMHNGPDSYVYRMLYHSRSTDGTTDVAVSGTLWIPAAQAPPDGFPIVAFAPGNNGPGDGCVDSRAEGAWAVEYAAVAANLVREGYVVAYTDYEGHGTPAAYRMNVGESETHAILDGARAARSLLGDAASDRMIVYGHSLGAGAASSVLTYGPGYSDGLDVRGIVVVDGAKDHVRYVERLVRDEETALGMLGGVLGYTASYPELRAEDIFTPAGMEALRVFRAEEICETSEFAQLTGSDVLARNPFELPDWAARIRTGVATTSPYPSIHLSAGAGAPDRFADAQEEVDLLCGADLWHYAYEDHNSVIWGAWDRALDWMNRRIDEPARLPSGCN